MTNSEHSSTAADAGAAPQTASPGAALPDEDRLAFPKSWRRFVSPRRGDARPRRLTFDPEAGAVFRERHEAAVRGRLSIAANEPYAEAGLAFLDGAADVLGAAAVMTLAQPCFPPSKSLNREVFDMVALERGLPFAASAVAGSFAFEIEETGGLWGQRLAPRTLTHSNWSRLKYDDEVREVRMHLAALPDDEYAAVVAALERVRTGPVTRFAVSLLVPDEQEWLDEVCAEHQAQQGNWSCRELLMGVVSTAEQLAGVDPSTMRSHWVRTADLADLLHRLGPAALPAFERHLSDHLDAGDKRTLYRALAAIPTDAAFGLLADRLEDPVAMGFAMEAAERFPQRALRVAASRVEGADAAVAQRFSALLHAHPIVLEVALPLQEAGVRETVEGLVGTGSRVAEADAALVPPLLTAPPWDRPADTTVVKGLTPPAINRVVWAEGEREAWSEAENWRMRSRSKADWERDALTFADRGADNQAVILICLDESDARELLPLWDAGAGHVYIGYLKRLLARFGDEAAGQVATAAAVHAELSDALLPIVTLDAARYVADALVRLKTKREFANAWLERHEADAAALLIPDALGKGKRRRVAASTALRTIAAKHGADLVREAAAAYGEEAAAAIAPLVDPDPLTPVGVLVPVPGAWATPAALPQVLLADGRGALPDTAVKHLIVVLALGALDPEYPGIAIIAEACDAASLAAFSTALFERWLAAGGPSKDDWALAQLARFGGDDAVRLLAPLIAKWPGEAQHQRAVKALKVLGAIGSEAALRAVHGIAEKSKFDAIRWEADRQIEEVARRLGLTTDQLADRLVPEFGLRDTDALVLDYGPRVFKVGFDEALRPFVTDADGTPRKTLPKPGAKDDGPKAEAAYRRFAALRKDLRTVASDQVKRLEKAMVHGRSWMLGEFEERIVRHPLMWQLARRLVWQGGSAGTAFRLAEDRTLTGVDEEPLRLSPVARIRLAHPALLGDECDAWAEVFADYELVQPFPQLARPVMAFTDDELKTGRLTRFEGVTVPVGNVLGLVNRGWERAAPQDGGIEPGVSFTLPGAGYVVVGLDPGIAVGALDLLPQQTLRSVRVTGDRYRWGQEAALEGFGPVDPVIASEALVALAKAAGVD